jgi:hypothetical protein
VTVGREVPAGGDILIALGVDPTGVFDTNLAEWQNDPAEMPGAFSGSIIWSSGELARGPDPVWIEVRRAAVDVFHEAAAPISAPCEPWAHEVEG